MTQDEAARMTISEVVILVVNKLKTIKSLLILMLHILNIKTPVHRTKINCKLIITFIKLCFSTLVPKKHMLPDDRRHRLGPDPLIGGLGRIIKPVRSVTGIYSLERLLDGLISAGTSR